MTRYIVFAALLAATVAYGQPPQAPPFTPPQAPEVLEVAPKKSPKSNILPYANAREEAAKGKRCAVFIGVPARDIDGVACASVAHDGPWRQYNDKSVVVFEASTLVLLGNVSLATTDEEIRAGGKKAVQPSAIPFVAPFSNRQPAGRDGSPWLSVGEHRKVWDMWPEGVAYPPTLGFYKLRPASQSVAAFGEPGAGNNRRFVLPSAGRENANRDFPWIGSGGMDFAKAGTWRNVTGMALPTGAKIKVWLGEVPVTNSFVAIQREIGMHWEFPTGTQMFDVLIRKNDDGTEHIFNIRRRIKEATGWDDGASFFPDVKTGQADTYQTEGSDRSRRVLGIPIIKYRVVTVERVPIKVRFRQADETTIALNDGGHFFPPGFKGTGMTCNKCHSGAVQESKEYGGPLLRGKDTVFSWHCVPESLVIEGEGVPSEIFTAIYMPGVDAGGYVTRVVLGTGVLGIRWADPFAMCPANGDVWRRQPCIHREAVTT